MVSAKLDCLFYNLCETNVNGFYYRSHFIAYNLCQWKEIRHFKLYTGLVLHCYLLSSEMLREVFRLFACFLLYFSCFEGDSFISVVYEVVTAFLELIFPQI